MGGQSPELKRWRERTTPWFAAGLIVLLAGSIVMSAIERKPVSQPTIDPDLREWIALDKTHALRDDLLLQAFRCGNVETWAIVTRPTDAGELRRLTRISHEGMPDQRIAAYLLSE